MANTPQSYKVLGQTPLDEKLIYPNLASLLNLIQGNPLFAFDFYKGMIVYIQQQEKFYVWETPFSPYYEENEKLLPQNFVYPNGSVYNGIDYSGRAFNFIELPYNKENIGVWEFESDEKTVEVEIYHDGTVNPFVVQDILDLWPNAERIAFISGTITGLKIYGQTLSLLQEFPVADWANLSYNVWNNAGGYIQNAKMRILEAGELLTDVLPLDGVAGNAVKELRISHGDSEMTKKSSLYFRSVGNTFEIYVTDKFGVRRKFRQIISVDDLGLTLNLAQTALQLLGIDNQVISEVTLQIANINNLELELNKRIKKPTDILSEPNLDFKYFAILDEFGESKRILASYFNGNGGISINNLEGTANEIEVYDMGNGVLRVGFPDTNITMPHDLIVNGDLYVMGDKVQFDTAEMNVEDNIIRLNSNVAPPMVPIANSGIEVRRGASPSVYIMWNELTDRWTFTNDGSTFFNIPVPSEYLNSYRTHAVTITSIIATITHPLNTRDLVIQLYDTSTGATIESHTARITNNTVQVEAYTDYTAPIKVLLVKIG